MGSQIKKEPWQLTAFEALPLLRNGQLKAEDYVRSLVHRIQSRDNDVKAWVFFSPLQMLREAQKLDDIPVSERGPLHGLPVAIKDIILTKDMPTQYNSPLFETQAAIEMDANCVASLRAAGAIIFGKTTTTEFAAGKIGGWHQNNTTNVYDSSRTPGGSSSGSAAAVSDFQAPLALGTQTAGSIIRPASFNGCYGFKPTWGAISREGVARCCETLDTLGFFARSVDDLDVLSQFFRLDNDESVPQEAFKLEGARFGFYNTPYWLLVSGRRPNAGKGTTEAMERAKEILKQHGAHVEDVDLPAEFNKVLEWHKVVFAKEGQTSFLGQYLTDKKKIHAQNIVDWVENGGGFSRSQQVEAYDGCASLRPIFDKIAGGYAAIITPSVLDEAPVGIGDTGDYNFCATWTILHTPALNIPGFAGENGLPVGLTAVGARFSDRHLLHVAKTLGPAFAEGGWIARTTGAEPSKTGIRRTSTGYRSRP